VRGISIGPHQITKPKKKEKEGRGHKSRNEKGNYTSRRSRRQGTVTKRKEGPKSVANRIAPPPGKKEDIIVPKILQLRAEGLTKSKKKYDTLIEMAGKRGLAETGCPGD